MANVSTIYNSGSLYEQLIGQVIAAESAPKNKLKAEKSDQTVYKAILSDYDSKVSSLNTLLGKLKDPFQSPFRARAASAPDGGGFTATASDRAAPGQHAIRVDQLARADARLSRRVDAAASDVAGTFAGESRFTIHVAQPEGDPVALDVSYTPAAGATNRDLLSGVAAAINDAVKTARADGRLAEGTGAAASVVNETSGTSRLSLRSLETGYANRLTFTDTDGLLADLEVDRTAVRSGTGGGAVYAVGTGPEDSALSAAFSLDGLTLYRDSNTVDDALDGVTFTLSKVTDAPETLAVGADVDGMRAEVEAFIAAYNDVASFLNAKSKVDADAGTRGVFAGDASVRGLRYGMRADLARAVEGAGDLRGLADLGITTSREGTLSLADPDKLTAALAASPEAVDALFSGADGLAERLGARLEGLTGTQGIIAQRKKSADDRISRLGAQIERWDTRLSRREDLLRAQFARLEGLTTQAQGQQATIASMYYF